MTRMVLPHLSAEPCLLRRSGFRWLQPDGARVEARQPIAVCYVRVGESATGHLPMPEEQHDLQVVLAPARACTIRHLGGVSEGGYRDLVDTGEWRAGEHVGDCDLPEGSGALLALVLAGRRGFESGEGRGSLLAGWHDRVRGYWQGDGDAPVGSRYGTVLALGTCEQTAVFRGEDTAFLSWFKRAPGAAQVIAVGDERCVHSSAVLLQHLRRTPEEGTAIAESVHAWMAGRIRGLGAASFPGLAPGAARGTLQGRWPEAQELSHALHLLGETVGTSPIIEQTEVLTATGVRINPPADAISLTLGSEVAPHYRHRKTGWLFAAHGFRFGSLMGPAVTAWVRDEFEPVRRSVSDIQRDVDALAAEVEARTGALLLVQNLIASTAADRIANYSWLGDAFDECLPVQANELNLAVHELTRTRRLAVVDNDAMAAALGVDHCPDRFHGSRELVDAQRDEVHRILVAFGVLGF